MNAAGADPRNAEYIPRYVKPAPPVSSFGLTSPRKTMHPTTDELVRAHHRAELKIKIASIERERQHVREVEARDRQAVERLLEEKHNLMAKLGIGSSSQDVALDGVHPADNSDPIMASLRSKMRCFLTSDGATTNSSISPRTSGLASRDIPTKELLSKAGLERLYPETALITATLADGSWFRIPKSNPASSTLPSVRGGRAPCLTAAGDGTQRLPLVAPVIPQKSPRTSQRDTAAQSCGKDDKGAHLGAVVRLPSIPVLGPFTAGGDAIAPSPRRPLYSDT